MFEIINQETHRDSAKIVVFGVGGAGGNAIQTMINSHLSGVEFIAANTDMQALKQNKAEKKIQLGEELTRGLGAGANPNIGRQAAIESCEAIARELENVDMIFITAGMGGGTGTGAASIIADIARQKGILTVGVVTRPFSFEGKRRSFHADIGIEALREKVDTLIVVPNEKLLDVSDRNTPILNTFRKADDVLVKAVRGISDLINVHGLINLDFADVRTVMFEQGLAIMGAGAASGKNRVLEATKQAVHSPLLDNISIRGAQGVIINITGDSHLSLMEVNEASQMVTDLVHEDAEIIFGAVIDESFQEGEVHVTVIATGFEEQMGKNNKPTNDPGTKNMKNILDNSCISDDISFSGHADTEQQESKNLSSASKGGEPRERLLKKAKQYSNERHTTKKQEESSSSKKDQLSMELQEEKSSNNLKKSEKDSKSPFGTKNILKDSLSFFLDH